MNNSFKELHIRIRHLSLFYYEDISINHLELIDTIASKDFEDIKNDEIIIKSMIHLVEKYKKYF